jgi:hypothetical protein
MPYVCARCLHARSCFATNKARGRLDVLIWQSPARGQPLGPGGVTLKQIDRKQWCDGSVFLCGASLRCAVTMCRGVGEEVSGKTV